VEAPVPALFSLPSRQSKALPSNGLPLVASGTLHVGVLTAVALVAALSHAPVAARLTTDQPAADEMRLVFLAIPGPGGGGGGGGLRQPTPPPKAQRQGRSELSSPLPERRPPEPEEPSLTLPEPQPKPLSAEQLPTVMAPVVTARADGQDRIGALKEVTNQDDSHGRGAGGGTGTGTGTGIGEGEGPGVGPGTGGGIGGGPYRPGSGISPPKLLYEVKADYTEAARLKGLAGQVVLEVIVRRDGTVGDVKVLQGLGSGLNERAVQAVQQWRFSPARRLGTPVDVVVEVSVEFKLR
jgi:TonB family protein